MILNLSPTIIEKQYRSLTYYGNIFNKISDILKPCIKISIKSTKSIGNLLNNKDLIDIMDKLLIYLKDVAKY